MGDVFSSAIRLTRLIRLGLLSVKQTQNAITRLDRKYGDWDMLVTLPDKYTLSSVEYLNELSNMTYSGLLSKDAFMEMAYTANDLYGIRRRIILFLVPLLLIIAIVVLIIVAVINGG